MIEAMARPKSAATAAILEQLNAEIAAHGHSVKSMAAAIGRDYNTFRRWLTGEREMPLPVLMEALRVLHLEPAVFFARARARESDR